MKLHHIITITLITVFITLALVTNSAILDWSNGTYNILDVLF